MRLTLMQLEIASLVIGLDCFPDSKNTYGSISSALPEW